MPIKPPMVQDLRNPPVSVDREAEAPIIHSAYADDAMKGERRKAGIRDIVGGAVLIGIGLAYGGSIFTGTADAIDWAFDLLGSFWVLKGVYQLVS